MRVSTDKALNDEQHWQSTLIKPKCYSLQATAVHGRSLDDSLLTQSFRIKQINVRPSNKQTVVSEHLFETIIIVTVAQKDIRLNYASWPRTSLSWIKVQLA